MNLQLMPHLVVGGHIFQTMIQLGKYDMLVEIDNTVEQTEFLDLH